MCEGHVILEKLALLTHNRDPLYIPDFLVKFGSLEVESIVPTAVRSCYSSSAATTMVDSDDEYIEADSGDEGAHYLNTKKGNRRSGGVGTRSKAKAAPVNKEKWEEIHRSWDQVVEAADGSIASTVIGLLESTKRKRVLRDATPLQRGIIRHMVLVLDLSTAMMEKDFRPTRYLVTLRYAVEFIREFFEQNPISQIAIVGMRDGVAVRISEMSGNPVEHITAIQRLRQEEPKGNPSLQNALDMSRAALLYIPHFYPQGMSRWSSLLIVIVLKLLQPYTLPWYPRSDDNLCSPIIS